jgi:serine protease Do
MYHATMLNRFIIGMLGTAVSLMAASDVLQLKDNASVSGKILAEKKDQVAIDIGYTVLVIPRNQIHKISRESAESPAGANGKKQVTAAKPRPRNTAPPSTNSAPPPPDPETPREPASKLFAGPTRSSLEKTVRELAAELGEAVVQVRTPAGLGSGFIIHEEGFLITNFHVIEGETQISVEVYHQRGGQLDRRSYKQVRIVAMNKFADLALLKIEDKDAPKFSWVFLGESDATSVGERVFAIGSPLGLERTVTEGILSTKTRQMQGELYLQTTTPINPGNSGGPLFNMRGEVIGVTNMKLTFAEGLGFAIPVETVKFFLTHRDAFAYDNDNPNNAYRYLAPPSRTHHKAGLNR